MKCQCRTIPPAPYTKNAEAFFAPVPAGRTRSRWSLDCAPKPPRAALREARAGDVRRGERWRACRFPRLGFPPGPLFRGAPFQADHHQGEKPIQGDTARLHLCLKGAALRVPATTRRSASPRSPRPGGTGSGLRAARALATAAALLGRRSQRTVRQAHGALCRRTTNAQAVIHSRRA